ncbi:MAG: YqgE/AlgH family protein [Gammaproteobacteria bacterium]|nr:MAG: YqgE/AlgH family protein [Gammaproteobacteria bacterium]
MESTILTNQLLIAMPALQDPSFSHTVSYICEHNEEGAMGLVINRPLGITVSELFEQIEIDINPTSEHTKQQVYLGGPVQQERGFVLHTLTHDWDSTLQITDNLAITTSLDILKAIASGEGPENFLLALGYAGWGAGQLEQEILGNAWLSGPANEEILFRSPTEERWKEAASIIGVDMSSLHGQAGHA